MTNATTPTTPNETWQAWLDGGKPNAVSFNVPADAITFDVAQAGADALGIDVCDALNVERIN
jgi:hypothetical protein